MSINENMYNILLPAVMALPIKLFGYSHHTYVFLTFIMFLLPTALVQGMIAVKLTSHATSEGGLKGDTVFVLAVIMALIFPANYYSMFMGYVDVAYLLPLSVAMYLFIDYDMRRINVAKDIGIAVMLCLAWLCRRYVVYFIIGYVAAMVSKAVFTMIQDKGFKSIKSILLNLWIIMGAAISSLLLLFGKFVWRAMASNYGHQYSTWQSPLSENLSSLLSVYGAVLVVVIFCIGITCFALQKRRGTYLSLVIFAVCETAVFWHTQRMDPHQKMILNLPIFIICLLPYGMLNKKAASKSLLAAVGAVFALNFASAFFINLHGVFSYRHKPLYRDDTANVLALVDKLNDLTCDTDEHIYVASCNNALNISVLQRAKAPSTFNAVTNISAADADLRDGFYADFFTAGYCVVSAPISETPIYGGEIARYLSFNVQDASSYIGRHYKEVYQVPLQDGYTGKIYKLISGFTVDDKQRISDYFTAMYPEDKAIFADRIMP